MLKEILLCGMHLFSHTLTPSWSTNNPHMEELNIFTPWVFNRWDKCLNLWEKTVQHSNLKVKWHLRRLGWTLWVPGKDPASGSKLFPSHCEEEQHKSIQDPTIPKDSCSLFTFSTINASSGFPLRSNTLHCWNYWIEGVYRYIFLKGRGELSTLFFVKNKIRGR